MKPIDVIVKQKAAPVTLAIQKKIKPISVVVEGFPNLIRMFFSSRVYIRTAVSVRSALEGMISGKIRLQSGIDTHMTSEAGLKQKALFAPYIRANARFGGAMDIKTAFRAAINPTSRTPYKVSDYTGVTVKQAIDGFGRRTAYQFIWREF